ncbi:MAG: hypothetical protein IT546_14125 [Caulobacteraceae bacterium]|nr:hypothetical protein [Caulobacteraceae bacterium]
MKPLFALALAAALALPAAASNAQDAPRQCFHLSRMEGTRAADASTLYAKVGRDTWRFDMAGACLSTVASDGLIVEPVGGRSTVCGPLDLNIRARNGGIVTSCIVRSLTRLTPDEAAALPKKARP